MTEVSALVSFERPSSWFLTAVLGGMSLLHAGCSGSAPPPVPVPARVATPPAPTGDPEIGQSGVFPSKRFGIQLPLVDGTSWRIDDRRTPWLSATQATTSSTLMVRLWRDENRMTRDKCEARARSWRTLPRREDSNILEERPIDVPPGFDTTYVVGLVPDEHNGDLFGFVMAFGGFSHKCFTYVYVTNATGPNADAKVGDRLAKIVEASLTKIRFVSELTPAVEEAPTP